MRRSFWLRLGGALLLSGALAWLLPARGERDGWSLLPPLVAILVAMFTGRLALGLAMAILSGAALSLPASVPAAELPWAILRRAAVDFLWTPLRESFQLYILGFTAALIGMVRVIALAGGTQGIADFLAARAESARSTRITAFLLGVAIFFDDYASSLVVGTTMRPVVDRFRVAREKLAYLADSTSAPVAGIALISTWIGYEVGIFEELMGQLQAGISGYELFFRAMPTRFYCLLTLVFGGLSVFLRRDFGPMLRAERRARRGEVMAPGARLLTRSGSEGVQPPPGVQPHWRTAAIPVGLVIGGVFAGMQLDTWDDPEVGEARRQYSLLSYRYWTAVFSRAENTKVMFLAALAGTLAVFLLALRQRDPESGQRPIRLGRALRVWSSSLSGFHQVLGILLLTWAIKDACQAVGTSAYLVALLSDRLPPGLLPLLVFLLAAAISFAIGTSWTTMGILLPTVVPLAFHLGGLPLTSLVAAAVLDGSIFGDHCSPISDTTVLSSIASACDNRDHVRTQLPYGLVVAAAAAVLGYLGTAFLYGPGWGLLLGGISILGVLLLVGEDPDR